MEPIKLDEEAQGLLKKIVEGQAYRQLMLANIRGHGIRYLPELDDKIRMADALAASLNQFRDVVRLYSDLGHGDVISAVRSKMERVPYPGSRMELAVCLFLCERVRFHAVQVYTDSISKDFAAIARTRLALGDPGEMPDDPAFVEFCAEETNRPHAQQMFNRWLAVVLLSLGRPGSPRDERAVEIGLRSRRVGEIVRDYLDSLQPFMQRCGLSMPDAATLGVDLSGASRQANR